MEKYKDVRLLSARDIIRTEDARINYLSGLIRIAECDNNKTSVEEEFIYKTAETLGASYAEIWKAEEKQSRDDSKGILFETKQEKTLFLMHALYMCWLDDDYSDAERSEIIVLGHEFGLESTDIAEIETWIKQGIDWMETGAVLLKLE